MAMTEAHCCRLLGVSAAATLDETRAAYRQIARRMHPDRVGGDAERFKEITAAYNWLVSRRGKRAEARPGRPSPGRTARKATRRSNTRRPNSEARSAYARQQAEAAEKAAKDAREEAQRAAERARREASRAKAAKQRARAARKKARDAARAQSDSRWDEDFSSAWSAWCRTAERYHADQNSRTAPGQRPERNAESEDARPWQPRQVDPATSSTDDAERQSIFGRVREGIRRVTRRTALDRVGHDVSLRLPVDTSVLMAGGVRHIAISRAAACPTCRGTTEGCSVCGGAGRVDVRETIKVTIPAGARTGSRLRLAGKGTAGLDGSADGDLYLLLEPAEIPGFRAEGLDLHGRVTIEKRVAGIGGTVTVELPGGKVKVSVPRGTRSGDRFRLRGQGLPAWRADGRGDLFLSVAIR